MGRRGTPGPSRRSLVTVDEGVLPFRQDAVRRALADMARYGDWWPGGLRVMVLSEQAPLRVRMSAGPLQAWTALVEPAAPEGIEAAISGGLWEGQARWTFRPVTEGTAVVLRLELDPVPWWLRLLARAVDLPRKHSRRMKAVFAALRQRLAAVGEEPVPEPSAPPPPSSPPPPRA